MQSTNMYGNTGSTYRIPRVCAKLYVACPFQLILIQLDIIQLIISLIHISIIPTSSYVSFMKSQLSMSQAFSKSNLIIISPLPLCIVCMECRISFAIMILSVICLFGIKLTCIEATSKCGINSIKFIITFVTNLFVTL